MFTYRFLNDSFRQIKKENVITCEVRNLSKIYKQLLKIWTDSTRHELHPNTVVNVYIKLYIYT